MLSQKERLQLQQLRLLAWSEDERESASATDDFDAPGSIELPDRSATSWSLVEGVKLHPWQRAASDAWFDAGRRGTIKVVTGAGKTIAALAIADRLHREDTQLRVAIVVPSIVLMHQWYEVLTRQGSLPSRLVGRLGGRYRDDFSEPRRFLIAVLASARKELPALTRRDDIAAHLLLVVDESHRAGAPEMSAVLNTPRAYSLGLSATPERGAGEIDQAASERLWDELGGIVFEMSFADAIRDDILPPFRIDHYGLSLSAVEAQRYQALTKSLNDARRELTAMSPAARKAGGGDGLLAWARRVSSRPSGNLAGVAARYVNDTTRRKQLLYRAKGRTDAALALVREAFAERSDARVILFHESINEVIALYEQMVRDGIPAVMEHSDLPAELRVASLDLFRSGAAQVIMSARSLIEGFNVPEADLGIVVASSSSPRQRIQSIGRVLRKHGDAEGEKASRICVLYVRDTVDESIYEKQDWDRLIGLDRNSYYHWEPPAPPVEQDGPPRAAIPPEGEIDLSNLAVGDPYPGRYRGADYSTDRHGNVVEAGGAIALNPQDVPATVEKLRGGPGRFRITPVESVILVRVPAGSRNFYGEVPPTQLRMPVTLTGEQLPLPEPDADDWVTLFGGVLEEPFRFPSSEGADVTVDASALAPGDAYAGPVEPAFELRYRQRAGGTIARRIRGGEAFARGSNADKLVEVLRGISRTNAPVTRFYVNALGHAFWREAGAARFLAALDGELEFPEAR